MRIATFSAGLAAVTTILVAGCGPVRPGAASGTLQPIPALAASGGATASMGLAEPAYPVPARVEYQVRGTLPTLPGSSTAYTLGSDTTNDRVSRLASALGVTGAASSGAGGWTVTGGGRSLHVERSAGLPWQLSASGGSAGVGSSGCAVAVPGHVAVAPGATAAPPTILPLEPEPCAAPTPVPGLPTRAAAEQRAESALSAAGLDPTGATVTASGGITEWFVSVTPGVGGVPLSGAGWSLTVGAHDALLFGSGWLATPASVGEYPLVGVEAGLDRLRAGGRWLLRGGPGPMPLLGVAAGGSNASSSAASPPQAVQVAPALPAGPATIAPASPAAPLPSRPATKVPTHIGTPVPIQPVVLTVTGVHLGLAWGAPMSGTGVAWLVPVYVFELSGGGTVPVIAVADGLIATPPAITPGVKILPAPAPALPEGGATTPNR